MKKALRLTDDSPAEAFLAVVKHDELAWAHGALRLVEVYGDAINARLHFASLKRLTVADAGLAAQRRRRRLSPDPAHVGSRKP